MRPSTVQPLNSPKYPIGPIFPMGPILLWPKIQYQVFFKYCGSCPPGPPLFHSSGSISIKWSTQKRNPGENRSDLQVKGCEPAACAICRLRPFQIVTTCWEFDGCLLGFAWWQISRGRCAGYEGTDMHRCNHTEYLYAHHNHNTPHHTGATRARLFTTFSLPLASCHSSNHQSTAELALVNSP